MTGEEELEKIEVDGYFFHWSRVATLIAVRRGERMYKSQVEDMADTTYSNAVDNLQDLEEREYVEVEKKGRRKYVTLTEKGERIADKFDELNQALRNNEA